MVLELRIQDKALPCLKKQEELYNENVINIQRNKLYCISSHKTMNNLVKYTRFKA